MNIFDMELGWDRLDSRPEARKWELSPGSNKQAGEDCGELLAERACPGGLTPKVEFGSPTPVQWAYKTDGGGLQCLGQITLPFHSK